MSQETVKRRRRLVKNWFNSRPEQWTLHAHSHPNFGVWPTASIKIAFTVFFFFLLVENYFWTGKKNTRISKHHRDRNDDSLPSFCTAVFVALSVRSQQINLNFVIPLNSASHYSRTARTGYVSNIRKNDIKHAIFSKWLGSNAKRRHDDDLRTQQNTAARTKN